MKKKALPKFHSEKEEQFFWLTHDSSEYIDWDKANQVSFPRLKPSNKPATKMPKKNPTSKP